MSYIRNMDVRTQSCIDKSCNFLSSSEVQCFVDVGTFSRGALEDRLLYRDLLASFVARAINNGFIEQADSRRLRGTKEGESAKRGKTRGKVLYRHHAPSSEAPSTLLRAD